MSAVSRRGWIQTVAASAMGAWTASNSGLLLPTIFAATETDSLPMQLYKSLSEEQRKRVCLPKDHPRRGYVNNWWYIHPEYRIPTTFNAEQQEIIKKIFDGMHSVEHQDAVNKAVLIDQYGEEKNAPAAGFFGTPDDEDFEFIFTGHHVTRRCNAHTDKGLGFGGNPIFYGHYPHSMTNMRENFNEAKDHPGNPYWYQGRLFNKFVMALDGKQQSKGFVGLEPRSEDSDLVIQKTTDLHGLACTELAPDQKKLLVETMRGMLAMFRQEDVDATIASIESRNLLDELHISWFGGRYDIGDDKVWDTWQIEGPNMVWYFRGYPHIHCYFHLT